MRFTEEVKQRLAEQGRELEFNSAILAVCEVAERRDREIAAQNIAATRAHLRDKEDAA